MKGTVKSVDVVRDCDCPRGLDGARLPAHLPERCGGFITPDDGSEDVSYSNWDLVRNGIPHLTPGQRIEFKLSLILQWPYNDRQPPVPEASR